jgi:PAS domain S-box-containing protein
MTATPSKTVQDLRKRAEEKYRMGEGRALQVLSTVETKKLLHELQVHQIELEMQNEGLQRMQEEINAARDHYFDLYNMAPVGYLTVNKNGLILEGNLTAATMLGVEMGALAHQLISRFILSEDQDIYYQQSRQLFENGALVVFELRMVKPDGTSFWAKIDTNAAHDAKEMPVCRIVISDITERKQAENTFKENAMITGIMNATDVMLVYLDQEFNFVMVNNAYAKTCRMRPEEMIGKNHFELYPDPEVEAIFRQVRDSSVGVFFKDRPFVFPDQPERGVTYWDWSLSPVHIEPGKVAGFVFSLRETTEFKLAGIASQKSKETAERYLEVAAEIIMSLDRSGTITLLNTSGHRLLGYEAGELIGRDWFRYACQNQ